MLSRRSLFATAGLSGLTLLMAACATDPAKVAAVGPAIATTIKLVVVQSATVVEAVKQELPNALTPDVLKSIATAQDAANTLAQGLSAMTPVSTGAGTVEKIVDSVTMIMKTVGPVLDVVVGANPQLKSAVTAYDTVMRQLPVIEAWLVATLNKPA